MTSPPTTDPHFADLLDELLEQLLNGEQPDLATAAARHPSVAHRLAEAVSLASSLAGRKVVSRPSLQGYEIVRELGRGGMGTVYLARQASLAREVALKVLPHSFGLSAASRQRFLDEARALAHVKHEHIVDIHRIVDDGELLAFEMEFIDGPSLHTVLEALRAHRKNTGTPATLAHVADVIGVPTAQLGARNLTQFFVRLLLKVGRALAAVHAAGFVHRDVKPANLLLRRSGEPVVVDFGLVRLRGLELSHAGNFAGTPVYSSPEQLRGDPVVGPASDVYSLAVTLYECLTLVTPFAGRTTTDLLRRIEQGSFPPLRQLAPDAPRDLETIVAHAMDVDPQRRYADGEALADDLQRLLELQPIAAHPIGIVRRIGKFLRRNQKSLLAGCAGALLVATALYPVMRSAEAASRARDLARQHVLTARQQLISIDSRRPDWQHTVWGRGSGARAYSGGEGLRALGAAGAEYDLALTLAPEDDVARRERDVVRLAIWLQQLTVTQVDSVDSALAGPEFAGITANFGPCTLRTARTMAGAKDSPEAPGEVVEATDDDRTSLGLLAFLFGDFRRCEQAWGTLQPEAANQPLVDAGLGRLLLADGMPEAAHAHLLQAQRRFPASATLALELADTALRLGDAGLAGQWLARVPQTAEGTMVRRRLELDLRAAGDVGADLTAGYSELARLNPDDPTPLHRLAELAMRRGDLREAEHRLDELLASWPEAATFRLDRARVALQRRDLPAYSRQVLAVLDQDFGRNRSRGTVADLLEILRIGGLESVYAEGLAATGKERTGRRFVGGEMPIRGFAPPGVWRHFEDVLRYVHTVRRQVAAIHVSEQRLDDVSTLLFVTLPLGLAQLPPRTLPPGLPTRVLLAMVPAAARWFYPIWQQALRGTLMNLHLAGWSPVPISEVERPEHVPPPLLFGQVLLRIDDVTGDGANDVLLTFPSSRPDQVHGGFLLVDGRTGRIAATVTGESEEHMFAHAIALVGDLDGDRCRDWLVGAPVGTPRGRHGEAELWSSKSRRRLARLEGDEPGFGVGVAGLGDCDGDGAADFAVATAPLLRNQAAQGSVQVFSGRTREVLRTIRNDVAGVWFGACLANAGDTDGDGVADLLVGGNFGAAPGLVRLYSGRTGTLLQSWSDAATTSGFGMLVGSTGDIDGDGRSDVFVTAVRQDAQNGLDQVFVYSGGTGRPVTVFSSNRPGTGFGTTVVPYCGEGPRSALAIGAPLGGFPTTGTVEIWSVSGRLVTRVVGPGVLGMFGGSIAVGADDDGDGLPELFIGGPQNNGTGRVWRVPSGGIRMPALRR